MVIFAFLVKLKFLALQCCKKPQNFIFSLLFKIKKSAKFAFFSKWRHLLSVCLTTIKWQKMLKWAPVTTLEIAIKQQFITILLKLMLFLLQNYPKKHAGYYPFPSFLVKLDALYLIKSSIMGGSKLENLNFAQKCSFLIKKITN